MTKKYQHSIFIFRRDLRLEDNTALIHALSDSERVIPCFIFDKRQVDKNEYKSDFALQFMLESLQELNEALIEKQSQLYCFYGEAEKIIPKMLKELKADALFINRDYTPFSRKRDRLIYNECQSQNIDFHCYGDALLNEPEAVLKSDGKPYSIFTAFFNQACQHEILKPVKNTYNNYYQKKIALADDHIFKSLINKNMSMTYHGGRKQGLHLLKQISSLTQYDLHRNIPGINKTSHLSPHNKFGTISIREFYYHIIKTFGSEHTLIRELYWRDFFTHVAFHNPYVFGEPFHHQYKNIAWSDNETHFRAWCEGKTGFPIVDAGMRELNATGIMHNRVRMITASFLVKDLHIDWREGEKYFAQKLVDYDPAVNNGNWQWAASTGCDAQPYFRIFNPWLQQEKFDDDCQYIKTWVEELKSSTPKAIHSLALNKTAIAHYPRMIVDHKEASQVAKLMYKKA